MGYSPGRAYRNAILCLIYLYVITGYSAAWGQDYDQIYKKYSNEQAVFTSVKEQLIIDNDKGNLVARSNISREKMLIGELSPGIFNKEYIFYSSFNKLVDFDASALVYENSGYSKLNKYTSNTINSDQDNVFYDDLKQTEVIFAGLTARSLVKINYSQEHSDLHMLPSFFFERSLPVAVETYEVTAPKYVNLKFVIKGNGADRIIQKREEGKHSITYSFMAANINTLKDYSDAPSHLWYALHIVPYITSYSMPGKEKVDLLSDPAHLFAYYYEYIRSINVKEDPELKNTVARITAGAQTEREKAALIYKWVQKNIYYVAFEDSLEGFIPRQAADICKRKFGDCKDMASIITAMCRIAGIKAYFTWIGTRSRPYTYEETPVPGVDNHMICTINIGGEWLFLDGTHPMLPFGEVSPAVQGKEALIALDEKNFKIIRIPETSAAKNTTSDSTYIKLNGNRLTGNIVINYKGYPSWDMQIRMMYSHNKDRETLSKDYISRGSNKFSGSNYQFNQSDTGYRDCRLSGDFEIDDYVGQAGKEYYVNMNLSRAFEYNHIDTEARGVPYYFKFMDIGREVVKMEIPQGYHVSYLPPEASGKLDGIWNFNLKYFTAGRYVVLLKDFTTESLTVPVQDFVAFNKIIDNLRMQYKETVVLTSD